MAEAEVASAALAAPTAAEAEADAAVADDGSGTLLRPIYENEWEARLYNMPIDACSPLTPTHAAAPPTFSLLRQHDERMQQQASSRARALFPPDATIPPGPLPPTSPRLNPAGSPSMSPTGILPKYMREHHVASWLPKKNGAGRRNWGHWSDICRESVRDRGNVFVAAMDDRDINYESGADEEDYFLDEVACSSDSAVTSTELLSAEAEPAVGASRGDTLEAKPTTPMPSVATETPAMEAPRRAPVADEAWEEGGFSYGTRHSDAYLW